jgi:CheY-like chemotaxis protein
MMKQVFVIDDDIDVRDIIVYALETNGFLVKAFSNGEEALAALVNCPQEKLPGLIIVDYLMPIMDGAEFVRTIQKSSKKDLLSIPLAVSSAMGPQDEVLSQLKNVIHLPKPMDLDDLLRVVKKHCS